MKQGSLKASILAFALTFFIFLPLQTAEAADTWEGQVQVERTPTVISATMNISLRRDFETLNLIASCNANRNDMSPCEFFVWFRSPPPPRNTQRVVLRFYKGGERILSAAAGSENASYDRESGRFVLSWREYSGTSLSLMQTLAEGGEIVVELSSANGLGQPVPYSTHTFEVPALPQRAIEIIQTMRTSEERPITWAREVLGPCHTQLDEERIVASAEFSGARFQNQTC
tara:strand:- start:215 stop:901 length:687 start_codon:yes stop_codon:yes gene_type:complete